MDFDLGKIDWTAVAALATLGLAVVTYFLARETRNLAGSTAAEVAAQAKPVLIPGLFGVARRKDGKRITGGATVTVSEAGWLRAAIRNAGPGIALSVEAVLDPPDGASAHRKPALPGGEEYVVIFQIEKWRIGAARKLLLNYRDTAQRIFSSEITISRTEGTVPVYSFESVRLFEGIGLVPAPDTLRT